MTGRKASIVASFISKRLNEIDKTQKQVARDCGWAKPNVVTMLKQGSMKLPLDRIGPLAKSLDVNPALLFWLTMNEYAPDTLRALVLCMPGIVLAPHELQVITAYRELVGEHASKPVTISDGLRTIRITGR